MIEFIYLLLIGLLIYIYIENVRELNNKYYKKEFIGKSSLGKGFWFFLPLISPSRYFREKELSKGYFVYLFGVLLMIGIVFLLIKLAGVLLI